MQYGQACKLARPNNFYAPHRRQYINHTLYFIRGNVVRSDHTLLQHQLCIGKEEIRKSLLKWNVSNIKGEVANELRKNGQV